MSNAARTATPPPPAAERERVLARLHELAPRLRARGITHLSLFGSVARGEAGPESDLDLLIEIDRESRFSLFDVVDLQDELEAIFGRPTHFAFAMRPWLREEILEEAIPIF
jgi:predicted nucleotidyltransferase